MPYISITITTLRACVTIQLILLIRKLKKSVIKQLRDNANLQQTSNFFKVISDQTYYDHDDGILPLALDCPVKIQSAHHTKLHVLLLHVSSLAQVLHVKCTAKLQIVNVYEFRQVNRNCWIFLCRFQV